MPIARPYRKPPVPLSAGFTLVELVIVITIIAILAAVAMPRLIDAQHDARVAKANAIFGSIRSASALARSRCELDYAGAVPAATVVNCQHTVTGASSPQVNMDGKAVDIVNRYPAATAAGIDAAADLNLDADGLSTSGTGCATGARCYDIAGGTAQNCRISYTPATVNASNNIVAPVISVVTTGC